MAYEWERDEWRSAVRSMSERDRQLTYDEPRRAIGITGDPSDAIEHEDPDGDDE